MEPDPGPVGLHPAEEGCSQENLRVASRLLWLESLHPPSVAAQYAPQLSGDQQLQWLV